jgi:FixJ family two-component response regulator
MFLTDGPDNTRQLEMIASYGFEVKSFSTESDIQGEIGKLKPHVVIAYLKQVRDVEMAVINKVHEADTELPVIFCGDGIAKDVFTKGMARGAYALMEKVGGESSFMSTVTNAVRKYQAMKVLNDSIDLIFHRFSDVEDNLMAKKDEESRCLMKKDLEDLLVKRKELKELSITLH